MEREVFMSKVKKYKCVEYADEWFTVGLVYETNEKGHLIDDDGDERRYARSIKGAFELVDEEEQPVEDAVNKPPHYAVLGEKEAIDIIRSSLTKEEWYGYCLGNIIKYRLRAGNKDSTEQDLSKADKYKELYEKLL